MIQDIITAAAAPFLEQVGWQGFAYGLLGLKTLRKMFNFARDRFGGENE